MKLIVGWLLQPTPGDKSLDRENLGESILIVDSIYSFTTNCVWWKSTFIRSFHSSVFP
jgi:hypothetical protein